MLPRVSVLLTAISSSSFTNVSWKSSLCLWTIALLPTNFREPLVVIWMGAVLALMRVVPTVRYQR